MAVNDCSHLLADLSEYLDNQASDDLCREIDRHMASCQDCRVVVDTLRKTIELYKALPGRHMSSEARRRLFVSLDLADFA